MQIEKCWTSSKQQKRCVFTVGNDRQYVLVVLWFFFLLSTKLKGEPTRWPELVCISKVSTMLCIQSKSNGKWIYTTKVYFSDFLQYCICSWKFCIWLLIWSAEQEAVYYIVNFPCYWPTNFHFTVTGLFWKCHSSQKRITLKVITLRWNLTMQRLLVWSGVHVKFT